MRTASGSSSWARFLILFAIAVEIYLYCSMYVWEGVCMEWVAVKVNLMPCALDIYSEGVYLFQNVNFQVQLEVYVECFSYDLNLMNFGSPNL